MINLEFLSMNKIYFTSSIILSVLLLSGALPAFAFDFQHIGSFSSTGSETESVDLNNDGFDDLISMKGSWFEVRYGPNLSNIGMKTIFLDSSSTHNGHHLAIGDVNGDGNVDIVTSFSRDNLDGEGQLEVFWGPSFTSSITKLNPEPRSGGIGTGTHFGISVAAGDIDGDGRADIIVGARNSNSGSSASVGAAFVYMGPSLSGPAKILNPAPSLSGYFGSRVEMLDHFIMISDPNGKVNLSTNQRGIVQVFDSSLSFVKTLDSGISTAGSFGDWLEKGDINNDGNDDLIVKGQYNDAFVFTGPSFSSRTQLVDPNGSNTGFGYGISTGDVDNDGDDDLVIGAFAIEKTYVYESPGLTLRNTLTEPSPTSQFGSKVAVGDIDGDGRGDVLVAGFNTGFYFKSLPPDASPPTINSLSTSPDPVPIPGSIIISSIVSDDVGVSSVSADIQGPSSTASVGSVTLPIVSGDALSGTYSRLFTFPSESAAPDGSYEVIVTATDVVGKTSSSSTSITLARATPPNAHDDTMNTLQNGPKTVSVLLNDSDPNGDSLLVSSVTIPTHGTVIINPDYTITYTPDEDYVGFDSFSYDASDGALTSSAIVSITIENPISIPISASGDVTWYSTQSFIFDHETCSQFFGCTRYYEVTYSYSGTPYVPPGQDTTVDYLFRSSTPQLFEMGGDGIGTTYEFTNTDATLQSLGLGNNVISPTVLGSSHFTASLDDALQSELLATKPATYSYITAGTSAPNQPPQTFSITLNDVWTISFAPAVDSDGDGLFDPLDNCPAISNVGQVDFDGDGIGDVCDTFPNDPNNDIDGDTVSGEIDNCPDTSNIDQADFDGDGIGDVCDTDADNDSILDDVDCNDLDVTVGGPTPWYADLDNDAFGNPTDSQLACTVPTDFVSDNSDCDDTENTVHPGAQEFVNEVDDDCDGSVDEGLDLDNDTFLDATFGGLDCDDGDAAVNPLATEIPYDGVDNDCSAGDLTDVDFDGFDSDAVGGLDCDDDDDTINPGATEIIGDGIDQDCSGADSAFTDDDDNDSIQNSVDTQPFTISSDFSDGGTSGQITLGSEFLEISDNIGNGVHVSATGDAQFDACGISSFVFVTGSSADIECGSVSVLVVSGTIDVEFVGDSGIISTATLTTGDDVTFEQDTLIFSNNGLTDVIISINGVDQTILAGESLNPDSDADGFTNVTFGGDDCDDSNPAINPSATEVWNNVDTDCDGMTDNGFVISLAKGQSPEVNPFLSYGNLPEKSQTGVTTIELNIQYGSTTDPTSFTAILNKVPITLDFNPTPNGRETVSVSLEPGRNVLILSIDGLKSRGATATDTDRLTFMR